MYGYGRGLNRVTHKKLFMNSNVEEMNLDISNYFYVTVVA